MPWVPTMLCAWQMSNIRSRKRSPANIQPSRSLLSNLNKAKLTGSRSRPPGQRDRPLRSSGRCALLDTVVCLLKDCCRALAVSSRPERYRCLYENPGR